MGLPLSTLSSPEAHGHPALSDSTAIRCDSGIPFTLPEAGLALDGIPDEPKPPSGTPTARVLLIDDDDIARGSLRALLQASPGLKVTGEAGSLVAANFLLAGDDYDLVLLDAEFIGGTAFDLMARVRPGARVIFVSAYEGLAFRAFEVNALDYLLKPVQPGRLASALGRLIPPAAEGALPQAALELEIVVQLVSGRSSRCVSLSDVSLIESHQNYSRVYLADGTRVLVRRSLKAWEEVLPEKKFARVHRTKVVNIERVTACVRGFRSMTLQLSGVREAVTVSRLAVRKIRGRVLARFPEM